MSTLTVNETYADQVVPFEVDFDNLRTSILNYFNTTLLDGNNLAAAGMLWSYIGVPLYTNYFTVGTNGLIGYESAGNEFRIRNTNAAGGQYWNVTSTGQSVDQFIIQLKASNRQTILNNGKLQMGLSKGAQTYDLFYLLSRYRKPRLEYVNADSISVENNTDNANESTVVLRDRVCAITESPGGTRRQLSLNSTANGVVNTDVGASVSGLRRTLTRAANTWYYIYAVRVQYGADADGIRYILVADTVSPTAAATLNTNFGTGTWVYLGIIRNGDNDAATTAIVQFSQDEFGSTTFHVANAHGGQGVLLASGAAAADVTYTVAIGTGAAQIPDIALEAGYNLSRASNGVSGHYTDGAGNVITDGGQSSYSGTAGSGCQLKTAVQAGYVVKARMNQSAAVAIQISLESITDHWV